MTDIVGSNASAVTAQSQSLFSASIDLEWHNSPEGRGVLAHLMDQSTGLRRNYGLLERPNVPPTIKILNFKLYMIGKGGVGKTSLVTYLSGAPDWTNSHHQGETPGIRTTNIYWPARIQNQLVLFQLDLWDSGETASKKYSHILPVAKEGAAGAVFVFSFTDRNSFEEIDLQLSRISHPNSNICPIVIGMKYGLITEVQVSQSDVVELESKYNVSVLRIRHQKGLNKQNANSSSSNSNSQQQQQSNINSMTNNENALILNLICDSLYNHSVVNEQRNINTVLI